MLKSHYNILKSTFVVPPRNFLMKNAEAMQYLSCTIIDRTDTINEFDTHIVSKIPTDIVYQGDFASVADATSLLEYNLPIAIMYSGGIDSTCVVCAFLKNTNHKLLILGSEASIQENPDFYNEVLLNNDRIELNIGNPLLFLQQNCDKYHFVTGECGAHIMGTINIVGSVESDGVVEMTESAINNMKSAELYVGLSERLKSLFFKIAEKSPIQFKTNYDAMWWIIFALKWQFVQYRIQMYADRLCPHFTNFFMTDSWQHWALSNDVTVKCPNYNWKSYKMPMRDYIYSYWPNQYAYTQRKVKSIELTYNSLSLSGKYIVKDDKTIKYTHKFLEHFNSDGLTKMNF